ncbi:hypothetical protein CHLRE_16g689376v5 [Chlamydomonas reinhardtii]|uniref:Cysteine-rich PDZ-binding protein n=1 Tax=Chlamydomonas reinhardtii TaxID=3055 RepID=A0A2K3CU55_CHLRE|nr:uncharacterized protein CHLRE_16g689376v5 [Chlamydomonas reinhardtii]PNW71816.1 hypothetical protein CHLRE_16g689376v5 [Chlamydomonas reinhardtii]
MVCQACEKKLSKVACPEKWRDSKGDKQGESSGRKVNENKLLKGAKRYQPYNKKCKTCKQNLHQDGLYCQACTYAKGEGACFAWRVAHRKCRRRHDSVAGRSAARCRSSAAAKEEGRLGAQLLLISHPERGRRLASC